MTKHTHDFVENYNGFVGFGLNRATDENTVIYYLQKFSDDTLMNKIIKKFDDDELNEIFTMVSRILKNHLKESEYHSLFLKE